MDNIERYKITRRLLGGTYVPILFSKIEFNKEEIKMENTCEPNLDNKIEHKYDTFRSKLEDLINCESMENGSNTGDWILADYLVACLKAFDVATEERD